MTRRPDANICRYCGKSYGTDNVCAGHETKCDLRPKEAK